MRALPSLNSSGKAERTVGNTWEWQKPERDGRTQADGQFRNPSGGKGDGVKKKKHPMSVPPIPVDALHADGRLHGWVGWNNQVWMDNR